MNINLAIGGRIKQLRHSHCMTQEELANRCELTKSYISQLENNKTSPSLATLSLILEVLGTNFSDFFHEDAENKIVFNKEEQIKKSFDGYDMTWLIPTSQKLMMESVLVEVAPLSQTMEDTPHEGEEFGYVLEGCIDVVYGSIIKTCKKGEAFYIETNKFHYVKNRTNKTAKLIWVSCPPNF